MATIKGTAAANRLAGSDDLFAEYTVIYGYGGNDYLQGGFFCGNTIYGGDGDDEIHGGSDINVLYGDAGNDYIEAQGASAATIYGGDGNDTLRGSLYRGGSYLDGGLGADDMYGGEHADTYVVDNVGDRITETYVPYDNEPNPIDTVRAGISYTLGNTLEALVLLAPSQHQWHRQWRRQCDHGQCGQQRAEGDGRQRHHRGRQGQRHDIRRPWRGHDDGRRGERRFCVCRR